jgi:hypothetical protein
VLLRVAVFAALIAAALVGAKRYDLFARAGLAGSCSVVATPAGQTGEWRACTAGRLAGLPDLRRNACTRQGIARGVEFWRCPAPVRSSPVGQ